MRSCEAARLVDLFAMFKARRHVDGPPVGPIEAPETMAEVMDAC